MVQETTGADWRYGQTGRTVGWHVQYCPASEVRQPLQESFSKGNKNIKNEQI